MSELKNKHLLQLFYRESDRVRLLELDTLPEPTGEERKVMQDWLATKRSFTVDEIATQAWVKTCCAGNTTEIYLHPDGSLEEYALFKRTRATGEWQLKDGLLTLAIQKDGDRYVSTVVANKLSSIHSAIEAKNGQVYSYLKVAQTRQL